MNRSEKLHRELLEKLTETNRALDRIASLLVSNQLLQECVSPEGEARTAEECASIVVDSFNAGQCLHEELISDQKEFKYQVSEFYIKEDDCGSKDADEKPEDESDDDEPPVIIALRF